MKPTFASSKARSGSLGPCLLLGCWLLLAPRPVLADDPPATSQPAATSQPTSSGDQQSMRTAKKLFEEGETLYRLGEFDKALAKYKRALRAVRRLSIVFNIAQCYRLMKQPERALFYYKLYLSDWRLQNPGKPPPNLVEVQKHIVRLEEIIRGKEREERARKVRDETVDAVKPRQPIVIQTGPSPGTPQKPTMGLLQLDGIQVSGAEIRIDGLPRAVSPLADPLPLTPGRHHVEVRAKTHVPWKRYVDIVAGEQNRVRVKLRSVPRKSGWWLAATITSTVLAAGGETLAVIYTLKARDHYDGTPPYEDDRRLAILGHAAAGVFAATAVTSLVFYLRSGRGEQPEQGAAAALVPLPGGGLASATWRY